MNNYHILVYFTKYDTQYVFWAQALFETYRGARLMGMEWSEIDGGWWTIPGEKTKNGLTHRVPLTSPALKILSEIKSGYYDSRYVFQSPKRPNQHISNPQKALERIQKATGIDFVGHDLRRMVASHMTSMGIPSLTVKKNFESCGTRSDRCIRSALL